VEGPELQRLLDWAEQAIQRTFDSGTERLKVVAIDQPVNNDMPMDCLSVMRSDLLSLTLLLQGLWN